MSEIILASQSPRRRELLEKMGIEFKVVPSAFDEVLDESRDPREVVKELALGKARDVAARHPEAYVIGSDTIVAINGRQMAKPATIDEAREMLLSLSSGESSVITGIAVVNAAGSIELVDEATTRVFFKPDGPEVQEAREIYLASGDWKDKAGGYGIQSGAGALIERIDGDYDTVVGLPTRTLAKMLAELGQATDRADK